ncbi:RTC5 [Candida pseudojiufengensis]|uniref:RTC5 n=1 Tax=Candida pseudojiufengensis TaxID=497109 RepID=UPI0022253A6D|nr:RTC5 [Candida pseudojiufengensis]KAI5963755.1 RTC5 [Candida pseudojiufengensis]
MGQSASSNNAENGGGIDKSLGIKIKVSKEELYDLFYTRCLRLLKPIEISIIKSKLIESNKAYRDTSKNELSERDEEKGLITSHNISKVNLENWILCEGDSSESNTASQYSKEEFSKYINILFKSMKRIGQLPFLRNKIDKNVETLDLKEFVISLVFLLGRFARLFGGNEYDDNSLSFLKLWYISINFENADTSKEQADEESEISIYVNQSFEESDSIEIKSKKVNWKKLEIFKNYNDINYSRLNFEINDLRNILTFNLILNAIPLQKHDKMNDLLKSYISKWSDFEIYSNYIIKFLDLEDKNEITFDQFYNGIQRILLTFISQMAAKLMTNWILNSHERRSQQNQPKEAIQPKDSNDNEPKTNSKHSYKFEESRLVTVPFISYISAVLKGIGSKIEITTENMFKLYSGAESGFSIRSLETKIFKWQSPTLFIVSGKRIKQKTIEHNKRYEKFDHIYPNYFLKSESKLKDWQQPNDRITYCVLINHPWVNSNKNNFGDKNTIILSISPHLDYYKSVTTSSANDILKNKSIYFNNLGMGLGFGNMQPLNKNNLQKYYPGDVSLTIESNLEFAIFRHLVGQSSVTKSTSTSSAKFFQSSTHSQLSNKNFEDRFTIIDLEVWGIGSLKNLEDQRKQWEWEEKMANERQNINLKNMGEERAFLEMVGLVGNHAGNGGSV